MPQHFSAAERSRIGIEWEVALVDRRSGELVGAAPELLARLGGAEGFPHITGEFLTNTIELVSAPHRRVRHAVDELTALVHRAVDLAEPQGIGLLSAGTHPFSQWHSQEVTPGNPRYQLLIDRTRWWGRQMMIWGVHVHIGVEDRRKVLPIIDGLLTYIPHFQALSASSPYWSGESTGYASNRALLFQQLPTAGLPPQLEHWSQYEALVDDLLRTGVIEVPSELRWDIRPAAKWGTIEIRTFDGISSAREIGAITALAQALVEHLSRRLDAGLPITTLPPWFVRENKWRAARYGLEAIVIRNAAGDERPVVDDLDALLETLAPIAGELGSAEELAAVRGIVETGASYQRQLAVAAASEGSLRAVVAALVRELQEGNPEPPAPPHAPTPASPFL